MEEVIDNGREKLWRFAELNVGVKEIFNEIASRNFEEIDPNTFEERIKVSKCPSQSPAISQCSSPRLLDRTGQ